MSDPLIKVSREGTQIGQYTRKCAIAALKSGELRQDDMYWEEGMTTWKKLSELYRPWWDTIWGGCGLFILIGVAVAAVVWILEHIFGVPSQDIRNFFNILRMLRSL